MRTTVSLLRSPALVPAPAAHNRNDTAVMSQIDDELLACFVEESLDSLQSLADQLERHRCFPHDADAINAVFRSVHSIKGNAGFFELVAVKQFSHSLENTLDQLRQGQLAHTEDLSRQLVLGLDLLGSLVTDLQHGATEQALDDRHTSLLEQIAVLSSCKVSVAHETEHSAQIRQILHEMQASASPEVAAWAKRLEQCCSQAETVVQQNIGGTNTDPAVHVRHEQPIATLPESASNLSEAAAPSSAAVTQARMVRVREQVVDQFLDDVSSMFITAERFKDINSRLVEVCERSEVLDELRQTTNVLSSQTSALQKSVLALRRVPARTLLNKFSGSARLLADSLGKQVNLHIAGAEVEIDKTLLDGLDAPLTHMIRNCCDHALETPQRRLASGKPEAGNIWLECSATRSHILITIRDDGQGIDAHRIRAKVIEKGLLTLTAAKALSDAEAIDCIFAPGFSTAEQVTEISGRGVGMDVVRNKIKEHGGTVTVRSVVGQGTAFDISIPVRQAVMVVEGLLVVVADATFVLPFQNLREIVRLEENKTHSVRESAVVKVRDRILALQSIEGLLYPLSPQRYFGHEQIGVVATCAQGELCLSVDRVLGQRKVVVTALPSSVRHNDMISGVAQLGGGKLALMLSVSDMVQHCTGARTNTV